MNNIESDHYPWEEEDAEFRAQAFRIAAEEAKKGGLEVGTVVTFRDSRDPRCYALLKIDGELAEIGYENDKDGRVRKTVPLADLVDINRVAELSTQMSRNAERIRRQYPN